MGNHGQLRPATSGSSVLPTLTGAGNLISGATARTITGLFLMPLTVIKIRLESSLYSYPSLLAAASDIRRTDGVRGFFSGFGATTLRDVPYAGLYIVFYESLKMRINSWITTDYLGARQATMSASLASSINFSSAITAGAVCSALSNPFDVMKTCIQLQPHRYRNTWQAASLILAEEGLWSLWDGLALRMSRKALSSALAWTVYEELIPRSSVAV